MHSFGFKVLPVDPEDKSGVPISVAGQTMVDIQTLITDIGSMMLRLELRLQNEIPRDLLKKFDLSIGGSESGIGSGPSAGNEVALEKALKIVCATLDFLGKGAVGTWMTDFFEDDQSRAVIAKDLIVLNDHLEGYMLEYGNDERQGRFKGFDKQKILPYTDLKEEVSAAVGVIVRDKKKFNHWNLKNDEFLEPVSFDKNIAPSDIPTFSKAGPVIVIGKVNRNENGHIRNVDRIKLCYTIPELNFHTIVTKNSDRELLNTVVAKTAYDEDRDEWVLKNDILGIDIRKASWDSAIVAFHEYMEFLFDTYAGDEGSFEGEEQEIREYLLSLLPVI
ncbi:MAG: hypothetical protein E7Z64_00290 [Thermoplasmata archaeon]|nr:hypothetical protein [Thermoplasmata archaeon]